ncbi:MAG TPA: hypothetical protein VFR37_20845 [Longimicrobium sp.]|nr:hypothetical protein [Longimicrobium sp.]
MKKLKLSLDELAVDSFAAVPAEGERGTVRGAEFVTLEATCFNSCGGTCKYNTCNAPWQCP